MAKGKNDVLAAGGKRASFSVPKVTQEEWDRVFKGEPKRKKSYSRVYVDLDVLKVTLKGPSVKTSKKS